MEATEPAGQRPHFERRVPNHPLQVVDAYSRDPLGVMVSLSTNGFMLISKAPIEPNQTRTLAVQQPASEPGRSPLTMQASCLWCQKSSFSDEFGAWFEFRRISPENHDRLRQLSSQGAATAKIPPLVRSVNDSPAGTALNERATGACCG